MRPIALLPISLLFAAACGKSEVVNLTARLVNPSLPADWCGSGNPDEIRLDCPFDLGLYVLDVSSDAGPGVVTQTVCVKMAADPMRKWGTLDLALNNAMAKLDRISQGTVQLELAGLQPSDAKSCAHDSTVMNANFYGKSAPLELMGTDVDKRFDINLRCKKAFEPTATCIR